MHAITLAGCINQRQILWKIGCEKSFFKSNRQRFRMCRADEATTYYG